MSRKMYDSADPAGIPAHAGLDLVAGYLTGTPGDQWRGHHMDVSIDQAGHGSPVSNAMVKDIEPGAYRPADIPGFHFDAVIERPTVYCDRSDLLNGVLSRWGGDIWLAWPGWNGEALTSLGITPAEAKQIVAVQNNFAGPFDSSVILDPVWPKKVVVPPPPPPTGVTVVVTWNGVKGLVSRKTTIPQDVWDTLVWVSAS